MKYRINQTNYHTGTVYEVNKLPARSYFIPYLDRASADGVSLSRKRYESPLVQCLNGEWDFRFYPRPGELPHVLDTEQVDWEPIKVPGCWQFQGYDRPFYLNIRYQFPFKPPHIPTTEPVGKVFSLMGQDHSGPGFAKPENEYNFVGVYRRFIPIADLSRKYVISFLGVASCLELYANGRFVGYSEGSHNTAEFDLTPFLQEGKNELLAVVRRWCTGSYLECQDMFRNNGIFRDVLLRASDPDAIWDVGIQTRKREDGTYDLNTSVQCPDDVVVQVTLCGHGLQENAHTTAKSAVFEHLSVKEWTAETPVLYDLYFETEHECIKCRVGFRDVRMDGRRFLVNGKAIKFRGVNHHDTSPTGGYTMTPEELERDIALCKEYNINTIRTSHYPPDPYLLELCDERGVYVVDEADLETHGAFIHRFPPSYNWLSHDPYWEKHYVDRAVRLYERDKLHPGIVMWSLGNESGGFRNTDTMYRVLKERTNIPIHYEGAIHSRRKAYDVGSEMYPTVEQVRHVGEGTAKVKQLNDRPYFLCEYAHAMGVGPGAMEEYWKEIYSHEALMGGCIWEMNDHAVLHEDGSYTYGGDHGEWCHDGNFCVDGIFYPDRTPSTGARIAKFVYRPLRVSHEGGNRFSVFNTTGFTPGEAYTLRFEWNDGRIAEVSPCVDPMETVTLTVEPQGEAQQVEDDRSVRVVVIVTENGTGLEVSREQILLSAMTPLSEDVLRPGKFPSGFRLNPPCTLLSRVSTDNDVTLMGGRPMEELFDGTEKVVNREEQEGKVTLTTRLSFKKAQFQCTDVYEAVSGGVLVTSRIHCEKGKGNLPRFGKCWRLDSGFDRVEYLGRNGESYCDMKEQTQVEVVRCTVKEMTEPNIRPQESGNRMDCQYVVLSDGKRRVRFTAVDRPFELAVKPYSDKELAEMKHREDERVSGTYVTVQAFQMGIGTGSCGPATRPEYCFDRKKDYEFKYLISWE